MFDPLSNFKLNRVLKGINALPTTLANNFNEIKNAVSGVQSSVNTMNDNVNLLVAGRVVKSTQRGVNTKLKISSSGSSSRITISTINQNKSLLFVDRFVDESNGSVWLGMVVPVLYSNYITFEDHNNTNWGTYNNVTFIWRIIEFY